MDVELRGRLWTALAENIFKHWAPHDRFSGYQPDKGAAIDQMMDTLWVDLFKLPIDTKPHFHDSEPSVYGTCRKLVMDAPWNEVLDFIEAVGKVCPVPGWVTAFRAQANRYFQEENSAYRFVGEEITEITDAIEMSTIETGLALNVKSAREHLAKALQMISDRKNPDYRNGVKESISAVEATCRAIAGTNATLGQAIKAVSKKTGTHPAFDNALSSLYGWTSDANGIRHSLMDTSAPVSFADAKFMLVACSGFCNYLLTKAAEAGIPVK